MARSRLPRTVDTRVVTSSGADVPIANTVRPMTALLTPRSSATCTAPSTSQSAPMTTRAIPPQSWAAAVHHGWFVRCVCCRMLGR